MCDMAHTLPGSVEDQSMLPLKMLWSEQRNMLPHRTRALSNADDSSLKMYSRICSEEFQARRLFFDISRRTDFWHPQCGSSSALWFVILRAVMAGYTLCVWIYDVTTLEIGNFSLYPDFAYMTFWTFTVVGAYFVYATVTTLYEYFRERYGPNNNNAPITFGSTTNHLVVLFLLSAVSRACAMCVFVGFYSYVLLYGKLLESSYHSFVSVNEHAVVLLLVLLDVFASRIPVFLLHSLYPTLFGVLYLTFHIVFHCAGGEHPARLIYEQLDWRHDMLRTMGWVAIYVFTFPFFHFVTWLVYKSKELCASRLGCCCSKGSGDTEEEIVTCTSVNGSQPLLPLQATATDDATKTLAECQA